MPAPFALPFEPGRRVVLARALVDIGALLACGTGGHRYATLVAGRLGGALPVLLTEHQVERGDVGLDRGGDDVGPTRLARVFAAPPLALDQRRRHLYGHEPDRV